MYIVGTKKSSSKQPESVEALKLSTTITSLVWHSDNTKLYIGDDSGAIYICSILTSKVCQSFTHFHSFGLCDSKL